MNIFYGFLLQFGIIELDFGCGKLEESSALRDLTLFWASVIWQNGKSSSDVFKKAYKWIIWHIFKPSLISTNLHHFYQELDRVLKKNDKIQSYNFIIIFFIVAHV